MHSKSKSSSANNLHHGGAGELDYRNLLKLEQLEQHTAASNSHNTHQLMTSGIVLAIVIMSMYANTTSFFIHLISLHAFINSFIYF